MDTSIDIGTTKWVSSEHTEEQNPFDFRVWGIQNIAGTLRYWPEGSPQRAWQEQLLEEERKNPKPVLDQNGYTN